MATLMTRVVAIKYSNMGSLSFGTVSIGASDRTCFNYCKAASASSVQVNLSDFFNSRYKGSAERTFPSYYVLMFVDNTVSILTNVLNDVDKSYAHYLVLFEDLISYFQVIELEVAGSFCLLSHVRSYRTPSGTTARQWPVVPLPPGGLQDLVLIFGVASSALPGPPGSIVRTALPDSVRYYRWTTAGCTAPFQKFASFGTEILRGALSPALPGPPDSTVPF